MKIRLTLVLGTFTAALAGTVFAQQPPAPADALDGVDTVILLKEGREAFGKEAFKVTRGGFVYLFSSAETKAEFERSPDKYEIQLGGLCARMGKTVTGNPSNYVVHDGRIYIFGSDNCKKMFETTPTDFLPKPAAPMPQDAAAAKRGHEILDRVAAAMGLSRLSTLQSYVETHTMVQSRPTGDVRVPVKTMWRFPSAARTERTVPMSNGQVMTFGALLTPAGAFATNGERSMPLPAASVPSVQQDMGRLIVPLLRLRKESGTRIAAIDSASADGVKVDRVRIQRGGLDVILNIDPSSSRVHSTTFVDRNREGRYGEYTIVYADFRTVDGVSVPFAEKALFNGTADPALSRTLDAVTFNAPLDEALFRPTASGR